MKYKLFLILSSAIMLLVACNGAKSTENAEFDPRDTVQVPEGITGEDSIAYIENVIFQSPITAEQLLSLHEVHDLDEYIVIRDMEDDEDSSYIFTLRDSCAMRLANRFMRMYHLVYQNGNATDNFQLATAVNAILDSFCAVVPEVPRDSAIYEIERVTNEHFGISNYHIAMQSYVLAAVEYYLTYEAYRRLLYDMPSNLRELAEKEYVAWLDLNEARYVFWRDVSYRQEWYSLKPMEIEYYYSVLAQNRQEELRIERDIILRAKPYRQKGKTVTTRQWEDWIAKRSVPEDADILEEMDDGEELMPDEATVKECTSNLRSAFNRWLAAHQAIAAALPEDQGKSYDNLTADMHARIIQTLPSIVPLPDFYF